VAQVDAFVGASTPRFYYNLPLRPQSPQLAQLLVTLDDASLRWEMLEWARARGRELYPGTSFIARILEQGPPTAAPIEVRVYADDFASLAQATEAVSAIVSAAPATRDVRHDLPQGRPILVVDPHDAAAGAAGSQRADIALAALGRTRGLPAGQLRGGDDPVPVLVRTGDGERSGANMSLWQVGAGLPLSGVAATRAEVRPAAIYRRDGQRNASILAQLEPGRGFNEALSVIEPQLKALKLAPGVRYEIGGAPEASGKANAAIGAAAPIGAALLLFCLIAQFASARRTGIILLTIPLSAVGVVPGLVIWGQPFGFQSLLGVLSLAGIVVNNAIILIDVLDTYRAQGMALDEALERSVQDRLRPILLTTATTVLGLTPLLWSPSALWPPMASAMITGLTASTALTLLVVPAACKLIFSPRGERLRDGFVGLFTGGARVAVAVAALVLLSPAAQAAEPAEVMTLEQVMARASDASALSRAARAPIAANQAAEQAAWRLAWLPVVQVRGELVGRTDELAITTPIGDFVQQRQWGGQGVVAVSQPLLNLERQVSGVDDARAGVDAAQATSDWQRRTLSYQAATLFLAQRRVAASVEAIDRALESLTGQRARIVAMLETGRGAQTDLLRVESALDELGQQQLTLMAQLAGLEAQLGRLVGAAGRVSAAPLDWSSRQPALPPVDGSPRADRRALTAELSQIEAQRRALELQLVPTVEAQARLIHQLNTPLAQATWGELGLALVWTPFVAGTRAAQDDALAARAVAVAAQRDDLDQRRSADLDAVRAAWEASAAEIATMTRVIAQREQIVAQVQAQYEQGRAIITDVLEAEAALASSRARLEAARAATLERELEFALIGGR
jgi:outer membrane protein TolC